MDNLKVRGSCVPWKFPNGGQGQFLGPRALMSAGCLSAAARAACAFEKDETGRAGCLLLEGWTWEQRPALQAPAGLPAFPHPTERLAGPPSAPRLNAWFPSGTGGSSRLFLCQPGRRHRQWGPGTSAGNAVPWGRSRSASPRLFSEEGTRPGAPSKQQ